MGVNKIEKNKGFIIKVSLVITGLITSATISLAQLNVNDQIKLLKTESQDSNLLKAYSGIYEYYQSSNPDSAMYYLEDGIKLFTRHRYKMGISTLTNNLGTLDGLQGRLDLSKQRHTRALNLAKDIGYTRGIANALNGLGVVEGRTGNYLSATKYFLSALKEFESINSTSGIISTYIKLGVVNDFNHDFPKSLEYYNKAIDLAKSSKNINNLLTLYNNVGIIHFKMGDTKKALFYFTEAYKLSDKPEHTLARISALNSLGNYYNTIENEPKALEYFTQGLELTKNKNLPEEYTRFILNIENIKCKDNPEESLKRLGEALVTTRKIKHKVLEIEIMDEMMTILADHNRFKEAFDILLNKKVLEDSLFNMQKGKEIANLQSVFELEKSLEKINQLEQSDKRSTLQRNIIIYVALGLMLSLFALTLSYLRSRKLNAALLTREAELKRSNSVKDRLFSIIGHDLRGPIANIPAMLEMYNSDSNTEDEKKMLLDALNENSQASLETLDKLLHWGKLQLKGKILNQMYFNAKENIDFVLKLFKGLSEHKQIEIINKVSDEIVTFADPNHFNFVIRNLVSNALKFTYSKGSIVINAVKNPQTDIVTFSVTDNGVGIEKEQQEYIFEAFNKSTTGTANEKGHSIGLMLCKEFIKENGGKIWVDSEKEIGTTIYFTLKSAG